MLSACARYLRGSVSLVLVCINTLLWAVPIYAVIFAKLVVPIDAWRRLCARMLTTMGEGWIGCNGFLSRLLQRIEWDIEGLDGLRVDRSYFMNSNHQSWADIPVL